MRAFSNRCGRQTTLDTRAKFIVEYMEFARENKLPFEGPACVVTIVEWLDALRTRGDSAPQQGIHALTVFNEALELSFNLNHPAIKVSKKDNPGRNRKQSPGVPLEFILAVGKAASDSSQCWGKRLFCSIYLVMVFMSLRFPDALEVETISKTDTALAGRSVDQKNPTGELLSWEAPRAGISSNGAWVNPVYKYWGKVKPKEKRYRYLSPHFQPDLGVGYNRRGSAGVIQAALTRLEQFLGFHKLLKLHSARTWFATCARQLDFSLEERTMLGHWKPGSLMPNLYDRAACATEIKLRNKVLEHINAGWVPAQAFEIPNPPGPTQASTARIADSSADTTSVSPTSSSGRSKKQDISKLDED